ncbi:MAG: efflux RND transporter periplasmic adaptor subunit, partial [Maribacter sp.]|nr:efflux RND transporter periplasmic adaptor subunit [Maribacter sp.]
LTARVRLNDYSNESAILIPQSIISENATGDQYAYVCSETNDDNEAVVTRSIITTGKTQDGYIEVLSGISDGNYIVKEGARTVKDGQKVKILK